MASYISSQVRISCPHTIPHHFHWLRRLPSSPFYFGFRPPALLHKLKMSSSTLKRWLRPEVYPLFAALGVAVGICGMQLARNISGNPEVRVTKENRAAGVLDNFAEGEKYAEHSLRKFVRNKSPEIMPNINSFFADPK